MSSPANTSVRPGMIVTHPNRDKPVAQATRATVIVLLIVSAALVLIVTLGGWKTLEGGIPFLFGYAIIYLVMAYYTVRWSRGVLPISAALALLMLIFAAVAAPSWFDRDKAGFEAPALNAGLLGVITLIIIPVQILLITFAMRGFSQGWNVELEQLDPAADTHALPGSA